MSKNFATRVIAMAAVFSALLPGGAALADDDAPHDKTSPEQSKGASAETANSGSATFPDGTNLTANAWIQSYTWTGCGDFTSSAVMNASPEWIENTTSFYQIGFGSISIKGVSIESSRAGENTLVWTNDNGAKGSYLSGSVCGGWGGAYVGMDVTGKALYDGNVRIASTRL